MTFSSLTNPLTKLTSQSQFGSGVIPSSRFLGDGTPITDEYHALNNLEIFMSTLLAILTVLAGMFFIFYFVMGAFKWVTAGADSGNVQKARDQMTQSVIGMVIIVMSYSIIGLISNLFGFNVLQPMAELFSVIPGQ